MNDTETYLRRLVKSGYTVSQGGTGHYHIRKNGKLVAVTSKTPHGGKRSLANLRSQIRKFERNQGLWAGQVINSGSAFALMPTVANARNVANGCTPSS